MDREKLEGYILETYSTTPEFLWAKYPNYAVFRHSNNRKWFAAIMDVSKRKLGLLEDGILEVVNLKCDPILIGSLHTEPGFFPAYHMNKGSWITVALDGSVPDSKIKFLLEMSFKATAVKMKNGKAPKST